MIGFKETICVLLCKEIGKINKKGVILTAFGIAIIIGIVVALVFAYKTNQITQRGAVVSNGHECAKIGTSILSQGGSAVDAAIATLFCEGLTCPQSMGLGGGFFATIYTKADHKVETLIARETAPITSSKDMFKDIKKISGGIAVAVPGELKGYWALHKQHGKLPWATLIQPTIDVARNGYHVSPYLGASLDQYRNLIKEEKYNFREIFINPETDDVWKEGDIIKNLQLADTLEIIAKQGQDAIYGGGTIGKALVEDIKNMGGIVQEKDLLNYRVRWDTPLMAKIGDKHTMYTAPLPASGIVLSFIMNLLYDLRSDDQQIFYQRMVESFKHGYGQRTKLGDPKFTPEVLQVLKDLEDPKFIKLIEEKIYDNMTFTKYEYYGANFTNNEDHGTANMAVVAPNGDAIVVTSTINTIFGAKFRSKTGIILNDEMDDFSIPGRNNTFGIPPSPANYIEPGKIPMSSMCPTIFVDDNGDVRLLIGAAGGSKITSSVALIAVRYLMLNQNLYDSVQGPRLHHQLAPMRVQFESEFDPDVISFLVEKVKHDRDILPKGRGFAAVTAIGNLNDNLQPIYDWRRKGSTDTIEIQ